MGYDISNHPVDVQFVRQQLIPAITQQRNVDAFLDRAANNILVAHIAKQWAMRTQALSSAIIDRQLAVVPMRSARPGIWGQVAKLLGRTGSGSPRRQRPATGLPGFDSDLSVWGRPFFITADDQREAVDLVERYIGCAGGEPAEVDKIARGQFDLLETRKSRVAANVAPEAMRALAEFYPLVDHLPPGEGMQGLDFAAARENLSARLDLLRILWAQRHSNDRAEHPLLDGSRTWCELAISLPQELLGLAAQALPGWMGRGYVWPTELFNKIGVDVSHLFETPTALFEDLVRELPALESRFATTIRDNWSLGGYVQPKNITGLKTTLVKHRRDLILAWNDDKSVDGPDLDVLSADFCKIMEPVLLAEREGYGFIEASEVYSGFMGLLN